MSSILSLANVTKRYGNRLVVDDISFEVSAGGVVGLVGPNGAGKTTAIRMLLGLARPNRGAVRLLGAAPGGAAYPAALKRVGAMVEGPALYRNASARANLRIQAAALGLEDDRRRDEALLDLVGLSGRGDDRPRGYSLGMRQRLGIAIALVGAPELLILDEPTNGLDPSGIVEIRELLRRLPEERGVTVLVSSHLLGELELMSDSVVVMNRGRLVTQGPLEPLLERLGGGGWEVSFEPDGRTVAHDALAGAGLLVADGGPGTVQVAETPGTSTGALLNLLARAGVAVRDIHHTRPSLEHAFLTLTAQESR